MFTNQRKAYGSTLLDLCRENSRIVTLDADLGGSTMGKMVELEFPERHFEMGIAEANMLSVAAGLSLTGLIPFTASFAVFAGGRAYDQIRQTICTGKLNVKICGSSAGVSDYADGATHQAIEDIAIMTAIPNMTVICPADANETVGAVKAIVDHQGPLYLRLNRNDYENVTAEGAPFVIGKPRLLMDGHDVAVFATGYMCGLAIQAAERLRNDVSVKVVDVHTIKPLDEQEVIRLAGNCRAVVTAEEHTVIGGLGSAISRALRRERKPIEYVGLNDCFGGSAKKYSDILQYCGLTTDHICLAVREVLRAEG